MEENSFFESLKYSFLQGNTRKVLIEVMDLIITLWPYLVIGIIISTLVKIYFTEEALKKYLKGSNLITIITATILGIISPLGSYVSFPLIATFFALGFPLAPLIAFAIASPLINPAIFILTQGTLGTEIAVVRVISAIIIGVSAGMVTNYLIVRFPQAFHLRVKPGKGSYKTKLGSGRINFRIFLHEAYRFSIYISKHFALGIFIAALVKVLIPANLIMQFLGEGNLSVLLATGAGVPLYSCGGAALPVLEELLYIGVSKGAILAFCISGPAIKLSSLVLLNSLFRRGVISLYLSITFIGALFLGLFYQLFHF